MNFGFRFKQTKVIKFPKSNNQTLVSIEEGRKKLLNFQQQDCLKGNLDACSQLEKQLLEYLILLDEIMKQPIQDEITFFWNDSYEPNKFTQSNQWHYEYACQLYNLGIIYYHQSQNAQHIKDSLTKCRNQLWCYQKLQEVLPFINSKIAQQNSDLSIVHICMLNTYAQAFGYKKLYDHFKTQKGNQEQLDSLSFLQEANKLYDAAIRYLIQSKQCNKKQIPPLIYNQLLEKLTNDSTVSEVILYIELGRLMSETAKEFPKEQRMGKAIAYINKAELAIVAIFKKFKQKNEFLVTQQSQIAILKKEYIYLNDKINKNPIAKEYELLPLTLKQDMIKAKAPELFDQNNEQKQKQVDEKKLVVQKLIDDINQKKMQANQKLVEFQNKYTTIFNQYNLQFMLDAFQNAEQLKLTPSIQIKVDFIKERGGWKGYQQQINKIHQLQQEQGRQLIKIKTLIDQQSQVEGNVEQQEQGKKQLSQQQVEVFKRVLDDVQKRLLEASYINKNNEDQVSNVRDQLLFVEQNNNQMISSKIQTSLQESQKFYKKNIQNLRNLSLSIEIINNKLELIKQQLASLEKYIDDLRLDKSMNTGLDQFIQQQVMKVITQKINDYDAIFQSINLIQLEESSKQLTEQKLFMAIANQDEAEFENSLNQITEAFQNLDYGLQFYESISLQITQIATALQELINSINK
ncbi:unnamed protein product [Paramecium pentaurelia]|uniref:BRO1 domain-containing protein n=1 Tax=Paramecium pentaurelia TaxID=43138 RepID=A0A8S1XPY9_9CILI|nr:unnamed protein product [Paramecium pentaurelia]